MPLNGSFNRHVHLRRSVFLLLGSEPSALLFAGLYKDRENSDCREAQDRHEDALYDVRIVHADLRFALVYKDQTVALGKIALEDVVNCKRRVDVIFR